MITLEMNHTRDWSPAVGQSAWRVGPKDEIAGVIFYPDDDWMSAIWESVFGSSEKFSEHPMAHFTPEEKKGWLRNAIILFIPSGTKKTDREKFLRKLEDDVELKQ